MLSPEERRGQIEAIKAHPLYASVLDLNGLLGKLLVGGELDVVSLLSEALLRLQGSIDSLSKSANESPTGFATGSTAGSSSQSPSALPIQVDKEHMPLSEAAINLIRDVFQIYHLRCSAQQEVEATIKEFRFSSDSQSSSEPPEVERKTKHDPATIKILKAWLFYHQDNPYPTLEEKENLQRETNLSPSQLNDWFVNARRRILKK